MFLPPVAFVRDLSTSVNRMMEVLFAIPNLIKTELIQIIVSYHLI